MQVKENSHPYKAPPRSVAYVLQNLLKEELKQLQRHQIIVMLGVDETPQWCNSFVFVPKTNGKVRLCLDLAQLNKALIGPIQRGPMPNDIFPRLNKFEYFILIDASSRYHKLKFDEISLLITFSCPFGRYQYVGLPFGAAMMDDVFQKKIDKLFNDKPNVLASVVIFSLQGWVWCRW